MSFTTFVQRKVFHDSPYVKAFFQLSPSSMFRSKTSKVVGVATAIFLSLYAFKHYRPKEFKKKTDGLSQKMEEVRKNIREEGVLGSLKKVCVSSNPSTLPHRFDAWSEELNKLCRPLLAGADENSLASNDNKTAEHILKLAIEEFLKHTVPLRGYFCYDIDTSSIVDEAAKKAYEKNQKNALNKENVKILVEKLTHLLVFLTKKDLSFVEKHTLRLSDGWRFKSLKEMRASYFLTLPLATRYDNYAPGDLPEHQIKAKREKLAPALAKYIATHFIPMERDKLDLGSDEKILSRLAQTQVSLTDLQELGHSEVWLKFMEDAKTIIQQQLEYGEKHPPADKK